MSHHHFTFPASLPADGFSHQYFLKCSFDGPIPAELMREAERLDDAARESRKAAPAPRYVDPNQQELFV